MFKYSVSTVALLHAMLRRRSSFVLASPMPGRSGLNDALNGMSCLNVIVMCQAISLKFYKTEFLVAEKFDNLERVLARVFWRF